MAIPAEQINDLLKDGQPDWANIEFDINCSRCAYNLRMLEQARCPECGLEFEWPIMLEIAATGSDFLFEHNWRKRPVRSFATTILRSFRPRRFWNSVSLHERIAFGPLLFMFAFGIVSFSIALHGGALVIAGAMKGVLRITGARSTVGEAIWDIQYLLFEVAELPLEMGRKAIFLIAPPFLTLLGVLGLLLLLRDTLAKCRVRESQVFRVLAYMAAPISVWSSLTILIGSSVTELLRYSWDVQILGFEPELVVGLAMILTVGAIITHYLGVGLRDYLMLPRPRILAGTAAAVGILFMLVTFVWLAKVVRL